MKIEWILVLINSYVTLKVMLSAFIFRVVWSAKKSVGKSVEPVAKIHMRGVCLSPAAAVDRH